MKKEMPNRVDPIARSVDDVGGADGGVSAE
jgi:hypothetical protein